MAAPVTTSEPGPSAQSGPRADIKAKTLRQDRWWLQPTISGGVLFAFIVYATWAAFKNADYYARPLILAVLFALPGRYLRQRPGRSNHIEVPHLGIFGTCGRSLRHC